MKYFIRILVFSLLVSVWLPIFPANAQQELEYGPVWLSASGQNSLDLANQQQVISLSENTLDVLITFAGVWAEMQNENGVAYTSIWQDEYRSYREPGQPLLPGKAYNILIPYGAQVEVLTQTVTSEKFNLSDYSLPATITPAQIQVSKSEPPPPWTEPDPQHYSSPNTFPQNWYELHTTFQMRDYTILPIWVNPVRYSPGKGEIEILQQIELRLTWHGERNAVVNDSPSFDRLVSQLVINPPELPVYDTISDVGEGYLIITPDEFEEALQPFVDMKVNQGYEVTIKKLSELGQTSNDIKSFIKNEYNNSSPRPTYLLLVGDTDIDASTPLLPATNGLITGRPTDLYYTTMDDPKNNIPDYGPDIHIGRLPARTEEEVTIMVDKLMSYTNGGYQPWHSNASFIATCDFFYNSTAKKYNYQIAEGTHNYVIESYTKSLNYFGDFPLVDMMGGDLLYCVSNQANTFEILPRFDNGRGIITYSGHGDINGWRDIGRTNDINITNNQINNLSLNKVYSFVSSFACETNDFGSTTNLTGFGETWMLQENKGAIAFIGSAGLTQWGQDDVLEKAIFDSLFEYPLAPASIREAMFFGLSEVQAKYPGSAFFQAQYYWETYNLLGDPSQKLWLVPSHRVFMPVIFK